MRLYLLSHDAAGMWRRIAWPNGMCLLDQPWLQVTVFQVIGDELQAMAQEQVQRVRR